MTEAEVLEQTRAFNTALEQTFASQPPIQALEPASTRRARREGRGGMPPPVYVDEAVTLAIDGRAGTIPVRLIEAEHPRGAYLHIHGGGWVLGAADLSDPMLLALSRATQLSVVSVDYRLAPEHPFPAGPDDCEDAARWFVNRFEGRLAIGGESAGAQLAVLTLLRLRDAGSTPFEAANLVYGAFDLTGTPSRRLAGDPEVILPSGLMAWFADCFLPDMPFEERQAPAVSPLYADLANLPPALFSCGTRDPLLDDTLFMEARWRAAGNEARLSLWREGVHGFVGFPIEIARRSLAEQFAFLRGQ